MSGYMKTAKSEEWETPQWLFDRLNNIFHFQIDLACTPKNQKCKQGFYNNIEYSVHLTMEEARKPISFWCNPPYNDIYDWVSGCKKASEKDGKKDTVVMLIPASTEISAWHDFIWPYARYIIFLKGRLKFEIEGKPQGSAPKGSALVVFSNRDYDITPLEDLGQIIDMKRQKEVK